MEPWPPRPRGRERAAWFEDTVKIAFIVPRYGTEILGGAEYHCRLVAERMAERHEVDVLTTCARDSATWQNEYPEAPDRVRGVMVRRFANAGTRDAQAFERLSALVFSPDHDATDEAAWLRQRGPWCPPLIDYLSRHHASYDALVFFGCVHALSVTGLAVAPSRSILVPAARDEPALGLAIVREAFERPRAIAYNTPTEQRFLASRVRVPAEVQDVIGCGVDLPQHHAYPRLGPGATDATEADAETSHEGEAAGARPFRSHLTSRGAMFRRRHRLHGPFVLYGGRIEAGKGCEELVEYFSSYVEAGGEASLVLMGVKLMPLPEEPFITFAGLLSETERGQALEAATVVVVPSPVETLSLLALEAFSVGTPVLANARSEVLVDHCLAGNAGLFYADRDEFVEGLTTLVADEGLRAALGRNGREYVRRNYRWDIVVSKYERMIGELRK
jgi:glycosyltransferase involved in cell wall biosynthesis